MQTHLYHDNEGQWLGQYTVPLGLLCHSNVSEGEQKVGLQWKDLDDNLRQSQHRELTLTYKLEHLLPL